MDVRRSDGPWGWGSRLQYWVSKFDGWASQMFGTSGKRTVLVPKRLCLLPRCCIVGLFIPIKYMSFIFFEIQIHSLSTMSVHANTHKDIPPQPSLWCACDSDIIYRNLRLWIRIYIKIFHHNHPPSPVPPPATLYCWSIHSKYMYFKIWNPDQ